MQSTVSFPASLAGPEVIQNSGLLPRATYTGTLGVLVEVVLPTLLKGVIIRRPAMMRIAERLDVDRRAVRGMQRIRRDYGTGPVLLRIPGRSLALVLDPADVERVLQQTPDPFSTATPEKTAALAHFEPKVSLISEGAKRADRRRFNDQALESNKHTHALAGHFAEIVAEECYGLRHQGLLNWNNFSEAWFRIIRRVVFGSRAADDQQLSIMMARLRRSANWAFLKPVNTRVRDALHARIRMYLKVAEANSLAGFMSHIRATGMTAPEQQVTQWLFAFDAAGMTTMRALALLASHPEQALLVREEVVQGAVPEPTPSSYLRAAVLDTLRLYPTSPLILRESASDTQWRNGRMPGDTGVAIFTPFFQRDDERLPFADRFAPEVWLGEPAEQPLRGLVPFSSGSGVCPGRELVLLLVSAVIAELSRGRALRLVSHQGRLGPERALPGTLNHFALRIGLGA